MRTLLAHKAMIAKHNPSHCSPQHANTLLDFDPLRYTKPALNGVYWVSVNGGNVPNQDWCEQLYETKAAQLILYGRALGLSHSEAEDVLQDTFAALLQLESLPEQPENYSMRAFRNRALNYKRSLWRRVAREFESSNWFESSGSESPAERAVLKCLQKLPPEQREVIVLKIWSEYTFDQIGSLLEVSPNTVAGRYRYGLEKLRTCLKKETDYEQLDLSGEHFAQFQTAPPLS